jgi:hypothetical protein
MGAAQGNSRMTKTTITHKKRTNTCRLVICHWSLVIPPRSFRLGHLSFPPELFPIRLELSRQDGLTDLSGDGEHQVQVVEGQQVVTQDLVGASQVADVGAAKVGAGVAGAARLQGCGIGGETGVAQVQAAWLRRALPRSSYKCTTVAGQPGRQHAIEHVHPPRHALDQILRRADPHQVAGLVSREDPIDEFQHAVHLLLGLAHAQAADGIAIEPQIGQKAGRLLPQVEERPTLDDAKEGLVGAIPGRPASFGPGVGAGQCPDVVFMVEGFGTLVEAGDDVSAQVLLDGDDLFRREAVLGAIDVGAEGDAIGVDLAPLGQAKDLVAAGIGEDGAIPAHKPVQAAQAGDALVARAQVEVIRVGQDDPGIQVVQVAGGDRLDGGLGADGHEYRRGNLTVGGLEKARAGAAIGARECELKHPLC